jgi:hypothetical protein
MNSIRLENAEEVKRLSSDSYNASASKNTKISDKAKLDKKIRDSQIPLVQIMKLRVEDLHRKDVMTIIALQSLEKSSKHNQFTRKTQLAKAKRKILETYRTDDTINILKEVKKEAILT